MMQEVLYPSQCRRVDSPGITQAVEVKFRPFLSLLLVAALTSEKLYDDQHLMLRQL